MKIEGRKRNLFRLYAEMHLILWKDNENRGQKAKLFRLYAEMHLIQRYDVCSLYKKHSNHQVIKTHISVYRKPIQHCQAISY